MFLLFAIFSSPYNFRFIVHEVNHQSSTGLQNVSKTFQIQPSSGLLSQERTQVTAKLIDKATSCKYRVFRQHDEERHELNAGGVIDTCQVSKEEERSGDGPLRNCSSNSGVSLDVRQFVTDTDELQLGKGRYDKNIHIAKGEFSFAALCTYCKLYHTQHTGHSTIERDLSRRLCNDGIQKFSSNIAV